MIGESRDQLGYDIDGAVVKIDSYAQRQQLGKQPKCLVGPWLINIRQKKKKQSF